MTHLQRRQAYARNCRRDAARYAREQRKAGMRWAEDAAVGIALPPRGPKGRYAMLDTTGKRLAHGLVQRDGSVAWGAEWVPADIMILAE